MAAQCSWKCGCHGKLTLQQVLVTCDEVHWPLCATKRRAMAEPMAPVAPTITVGKEDDIVNT